MNIVAVNDFVVRAKTENIGDFRRAAAPNHRDFLVSVIGEPAGDFAIFAVDDRNDVAFFETSETVQNADREETFSLLFERFGGAVVDDETSARDGREPHPTLASGEAAARKENRPVFFAGVNFRQNLRIVAVRDHHTPSGARYRLRGAELARHSAFAAARAFLGDHSHQVGRPTVDDGNEFRLRQTRVAVVKTVDVGQQNQERFRENVRDEGRETVVVAEGRVQLGGADCVVLIADGRFPEPGSVERKLMELLKDSNKKVILAINKYDEAGQEKLLPLTQKYSELYDFEDIVPVSAKTGRNVDLLLSVITKMLPEGPRLFDSEYMTDQTERVIAAELIREQVLHYTDQEIPHGTAVIINEFKEKNDDGEITSGDDRTVTVIKADIICNRDSHKAIIIGKDGQMIKRIGTAARRNIEKLLDCKVYLDLYVKVRNDWQNNDAMLGSTGLGKDIDD